MFALYHSLCWVQWDVLSIGRFSYFLVLGNVLGYEFQNNFPSPLLSVLLVCVWASWVSTLDVTLYEVYLNFYLPINVCLDHQFSVFPNCLSSTVVCTASHLAFTISSLTPLMLLLLARSLELRAPFCTSALSSSPSPFSSCSCSLPSSSSSSFSQLLLFGLSLDIEDFTMLWGAFLTLYAFFLKVWLFIHI